MSLLSKKVEGLETRIESLQADIRTLLRQKDDLRDEVGYSEQIVAMRKRLSDLEIEKDKKQEAFDREKREVEHQVGLERRRAEFEKESAIREAELAVREQNLSTIQSNLQDQVDFMTKRFTEEVAYLKDEVLKVVISALPNVNVELNRDLGSRGRARTKASA